MPQECLHIVETFHIGDVVHKQRADGSSVVCRRNGAVPLLASGIPNLCLDGLALHLDTPRRKLDTDGRLGLEVEFVSRETAQQVRLADTAVTDQHCLEQVVIAVRKSKCQTHTHTHRYIPPGADKKHHGEKE